MKKISHISIVNFIILLISVGLCNGVNITQTGFILFILILFALNMIVGMAYFFSNQKVKAKLFVLSGLLILLIGGSSCVTIRFRSKAKKKEPVRQVSCLSSGESYLISETLLSATVLYILCQ
jgi:hypothetical protein